MGMIWVNLKDELKEFWVEDEDLERMINLTTFLASTPSRSFATLKTMMAMPQSRGNAL